MEVHLPEKRRTRNYSTGFQMESPERKARILEYLVCVLALVPGAFMIVVSYLASSSFLSSQSLQIR